MWSLDSSPTSTRWFARGFQNRTRLLEAPPLPANGGVFSATEPLGESHVASVVVSGKSLFETFGWADDGNALDGAFRMTVSRPEEFGADQVSDARTLATELFDAWDVRMNDVSPVGNERQAAIQKAAASLELAASFD